MRGLWLLIALWALMPAWASHSEPHPSGWFAYQYDADEQRVLYCDAIGEIPLGLGLYLHDRTTPFGADPEGGGLWFFWETNGLLGLQIGGSPLSGDHLIDPREDPFRKECPNGDTRAIY